MKNKNIPKDTSFEYGESYQNDQVKKHIDRHNNHWQTELKKLMNWLEFAIAFINLP